MKKFLSNPTLVLGAVASILTGGIVYMISSLGMHLYLAILTTGVCFMFLEKFNRTNDK